MRMYSGYGVSSLYVARGAHRLLVHVKARLSRSQRLGENAVDHAAVSQSYHHRERHANALVVGIERRGYLRLRGGDM